MIRVVAPIIRCVVVLSIWKKWLLEDLNLVEMWPSAGFHLVEVRMSLDE